MSVRTTVISVKSDAVALAVAAEVVVRFQCPHCLKRLRRSYSFLLETGAEAEPMPETVATCGFCHGKIRLEVETRAKVEFEGAREYGVETVDVEVERRR